MQGNKFFIVCSCRNRRLSNHISRFHAQKQRPPEISHLPMQELALVNRIWFQKFGLDPRHYMSIGNINTLFSLLHQVKKEIRDAVRPWSIRNLTDFRRHAQYCAFQPTNPIKSQQPSMPKISRFFLDPNGSLVPTAEGNPGNLNDC